MNHALNVYRLSAVLSAASFLLFYVPEPSRAQSQPVNAKQFRGVFNLTTTPATFTFNGVAPELGRFYGFGEVAVAAADGAGKQSVSGPIVVFGPSGDRLVGNVSGDLTEGDRRSSASPNLQFHWRDSVTFSNGTTVTNTGRFVAKRPAGIVIEENDPRTPQTNIIIRILITIIRGG
jgi:hypothetical protein